MKSRVVLALLLLIGSMAFGQFKPLLPRTLPSPNSKNYYKIGYMQADSGFLFSNRDTSWHPKYAAMIFWRNTGVDSVFWFYDTKVWKKLGTGAGGTTTGGGGGGFLFSNQFLLSGSNVKIDTSNISYGLMTIARFKNDISNLGVYAAEGLIGVQGQNGAIDTMIIQDLGVTSAKLANGSVTSTKIGVNAISNTNLINDITIGSLTALNTADKSSVTNAINEVNTKANTKISGITIQNNGTIVGTANQFTTLNFVNPTTITGAGPIASVTMPAGGGGGGGIGTILLNWTTVTNVATVDVDFSTWYSTYQIIVVQISDFRAANATNMYIRIGATPSTYPTTGYTSTFTQGGSFFAGPSLAFQVCDFLSNISGETLAGSIEITHPSAATLKPSVTWKLQGWYGTGSNNSPLFTGGGAYTTAQVTQAIRLIMNSGNVANCTYRIIGF